MGETNKPKKRRLWMLIIILVCVFVVGIGILRNGNDGETSSIKSELITISEFNRIETGMSYEEVAEIIGSSGQLSSKVDMAGIVTEIYMWNGYGSIGANANVTFQNGKVIGKAQAGLK